MSKEILIVIIACVFTSCGKPKKGLKGDRGNRTVVYEVEGQQGPRGEKGDRGEVGPVGAPGATGEKGEAGESCEVKTEQDGVLVICANTVAKIKNGIGCNATETAEGVELTCENGTTFIKHGEQGEIGPRGADGRPGATGPQGPAGRDGQLIVVPQPRYQKTCYAYIDSCDDCGNTYRYHIFYKALTMPNGDVLGQICEGYNVSATNCTNGRLTQATLTLGDPRYSAAPVASNYTAARLTNVNQAEINYRGRLMTVQCSGN